MLNNNSSSLEASTLSVLFAIACRTGAAHLGHLVLALLRENKSEIIKIAFLFLLLVTWLTGVECAPLENVPLTLSNTSGSKTTLIPSKYRIGVLASTFLPFDPVLPAAPYLKLIPIAQGTTGCWDEHSGSPKSCCWLWSVLLPKSTADHQSVMISFYSVCTEGAKM